MGLLGKRKKDTGSKAAPEKAEALSKSTFDRYFENAFTYQQQKLAEENASLSQQDAESANKGLFASDDEETLRNPNSDIQPCCNMLDVSVVGISSVIGKRESQQDAMAVSEVDVYGNFDNRWLAVLCDGMGGLKGGEKASQLCVSRMISAFGTIADDIPMFYKDNVVSIDREIASLTDSDGNPLGAGSTVVSVVIDENRLYWCSVGDSHIYIIRGSEFVRVNTEHNYLNELLARAQRGEITIEQAYADKQKDALTSFMGIGDVSLMDITEKPFVLQHGDVIVLCSDGLYRSLDDGEIFATVKENIMNMPEAARMLTSRAMKKDYPYQDNTSVIVVKYQDKNEYCN